MPNVEMAYSFRILDAADADIGDAIEHYDGVLPGLSIEFELCLEEGYADIVKTPLGYQIKYRNVRVKFIRRFPYGIHYLVEGNEITVISVFHQSKSPGKWIKRMEKSK